MINKLNNKQIILFERSLFIPYSVLFQIKVIYIVKFCNSNEKQILFTNRFYENVISIIRLVMSVLCLKNWTLYFLNLIGEFQ